MSEDSFDIEDVIKSLRKSIKQPLGHHDRVQIADWLEELVQLRKEREEIKDNIRELGDTVLAKIFKEQGYQSKEIKQPIRVKK